MCSKSTNEGVVSREVRCFFYIFVSVFYVQEMKQYHASNGEAFEAEAKLKHTQEQKAKVETQANRTSRKFKNMEKQVEKVDNFSY